MASQATKLNEVVKVAVDSSWIELAIEKYISSGGTLTQQEKTVLMTLSPEELARLKAMEQQAVASGAVAAGGGCGVYY